MIGNTHFGHFGHFVHNAALYFTTHCMKGSSQCRFTIQLSMNEVKCCYISEHLCSSFFRSELQDLPSFYTENPKWTFLRSSYCWLANAYWLHSRQNTQLMFITPILTKDSFTMWKSPWGCRLGFKFGWTFLVYGKLVKYLINFATFMVFCQSKSPLLYTLITTTTITRL